MIKLPKRQTEVLEWLKHGLSNKHIAKRLNISESTVKLHVTEIMRKYAVQSRTQLIVCALTNQAVTVTRVQIDQTPLLWIQETNNKITGFSTKELEGWTPVYRKL